jgi:Aspartyl/Asparaginyl beta-hydroxylase
LGVPELSDLWRVAMRLLKAGVIRATARSRLGSVHPRPGVSFVSMTFADLLTGRVGLAVRVWKFTIRRVLFPLCVLAPFAYFFPKIALFYAICGAYDVGRNSGLNLSTLRRYFIGNGFPTWVLSPFNILLDLLSLPNVNKGVYQLGDLPSAYQDEVKCLIQAARDANLVGQLEEAAKKYPRTMVFFRWYGVNNKETFFDAPAFHRPWKYIQTIGVSVFNKKISTSLHFGFMRASLRILYNLNDMNDNSAYIVVGDTTNYWRENKLFIFDDTLLHQSFNETDQTRYCLFVDIVRPSSFPGFMRAVIAGVRFLSQSFKFIYYQNWKVIER